MEESKELIVLGAIKHGIKKFNEIQKMAQLEPKELNSILEQLESKGFIRVEEKKGLFGVKVEMKATESGAKEVDDKVQQLQARWGKMALLYKTGDKEKLKQEMSQNKSFLPTMMFFGVMDMMMFSMMFSMIGMPMIDFVPAESMPDGANSDVGDSGMDDGGFDFDVGF